MGKILGASLDFQQLTTLPSNPAAGYAKVYQRTDNRTYSQDSAGIVSLVEDTNRREPCRVATNIGQNIALSGTQTIDSVAVVVGDRVLARGQTTDSQNGIWVVAAGAWSRSTDANTSAEVARGTVVRVLEGTNFGNHEYTQISPVTTIGTDAQNWRVLSYVDMGGVFQVPAQQGSGHLFFNQNQKSLVVWNGLAWSSLNGPQICTSSTRPGFPSDEMTIYETDTRMSYVYSSSAWVPITGLTVQDENVNLVTGASILDFQGAGVTATAGAAGEAIITIPGGAGGASGPMQTWEATCTTQTDSATSDQDVTGATVTVPVASAADKFLVVMTANVQVLTSNTLIANVSLNVAGVNQPQAIVVSLQNQINSRATAHQNYVVTGLTPGNVVFKMVLGALTTGGTYRVNANSHSRFTVTKLEGPVGPTGPAGASGTSVRAVSGANIASLAAASTSQDGITLIQGDLILLANQAAPAQHGVYTVGVVAGGTAPLTRAPGFTTSLLIAGAGPVAVREGTIFGGTVWRTTFKGTDTLDTTSQMWTHVIAPLSGNAGSLVMTGGISYSQGQPQTISPGSTGALLAQGNSNPLWTPNTQQALNSPYKDWVRAATIANLASFTGPVTVDGVSLVAGDRLLVKDQTSPTQNGIWVIAAGLWPRALDLDAGAEMSAAMIPVKEGTVNGGTMWMLYNWPSTTNIASVGNTYIQANPRPAPTCDVVSVSTNNIATSTMTTVTLWTGADNVNNPYVSVTTAGVSTWKLAGMFMFNASLTYSSATAPGRRLVAIFKNGVEQRRVDTGVIPGAVGNASGPVGVQVAHIMPMAIGDTLEIKAWQSTGANLALGASPGHEWQAWRMAPDTAYTTAGSWVP